MSLHSQSRLLLAVRRSTTAVIAVVIVCLGTLAQAQESSKVLWQGSRVTAHPDGSELVQYAADQMQEYLGRLTQGNLTVDKDDKLEALTSGRVRFVVGTAAELGKIEGVPEEFVAKVRSLAAESFAVTTLGEGKSRTVIVGGPDDGGVLYGVYDVLERLGCYFQTTGDILPEARPDLALPKLDYSRTPLLTRRGLLTHPCYPQVGLFSLDDWKSLLDQMAKLKMNYLIFYWFPGEP